MNKLDKFTVRDHLSAERHNEYLVAKGVDIRGH
jgi:hypothetical protein